MSETQEQIERRLAEIEARERAAKKGPWDWEDNGYLETGIGEWHLSNSEVGICDCDDNSAPDATERAFIAFARTDVPYLLSLARSLLPALAVARAAVALDEADRDQDEAVESMNGDRCIAADEAMAVARTDYSAALARFVDAEGGSK